MKSKALSVKEFVGYEVSTGKLLKVLSFNVLYLSSSFEERIPRNKCLIPLSSINK
jgi:hypothetical protein